MLVPYVTPDDRYLIGDWKANSDKVTPKTYRSHEELPGLRDREIVEPHHEKAIALCKPAL